MHLLNNLFGFVTEQHLPDQEVKEDEEGFGWLRFSCIWSVAEEVGKVVFYYQSDTALEQGGDQTLIT